MIDKTPTTDEIKVKDYCKHGDINDYLGLVLGEEFVKYRECWNVASRMERELEFPLFLVFETMFKCNLKCIMCIHSNDGKVRYGYEEKLPFETFKKIMDEASQYYCPSLTIGGTSEPLLDDRLSDMIELATKSGFIDTMVNTNATLLTEKIGANLINSGLTRLRIGFDGVTAKTYERIRIGADFDKVKHNITNFIKLRDNLNKKIPVVRISCVHLLENDKELIEFIEFWHHTADYVSIQRYKPHELSNERSREMMGAGGKAIKHVKCSQPYERLYIRGNGDVHACCSMVYGPKVGNVFTDSLYHIWNSDKMMRLRHALRNEDWDSVPICKECMVNTYGLL